MQILAGEIKTNDLTKNSQGGTETIARKMAADLNPELLKEYQIVCSRVKDTLDESKIRILVCQDLAQDPESHHLRNEGWRRFHRIVFVSHWQREQYIREYGIPYSRTVVIHNAVNPFDDTIEKESDKINIIYHTTPHRGLEILIPVYRRLVEKYDNIHLDVFSSFEIYGWGERDLPYKPLFDDISKDPKITYHGFKPNEEVRKALKSAHIFAYPSIWPETSCMALMEAMSAGCCCVHSDLAALPETAANWTLQYAFNENVNAHAGVFYGVLDIAIQLIKEKDKGNSVKIFGQKSYADLFYNWQLRIPQWNAFLESLIHEPREFEKVQKVFNYRVV